MYVNARAIIERDGPNGTEILLQVRDRPGDPQRLELPGGTLEEFEPILDGLAREVREETANRMSPVGAPSIRSFRGGDGYHFSEPETEPGGGPLVDRTFAHSTVSGTRR